MKPPSNIQAERELIAAVLLDNRIMDETPIAADEFYGEAHKKLWAAISKLRAQGRPADLVTLSSLTDPVYLSELSDILPIRARSGDYAAIIRDCYARRQAILAAVEIQQAAQTEDSDYVLSLAQSRFLSLDHPNERMFSADEVIGGNLEELQHRQHGVLPGLSTGFADLDEHTSGLHQTDLVILAARPAMGKSALAGNIAVNVATNGVPVVFFSLEMSRKQLGERMLSSASRVFLQKIRTGALYGDDREKVNRAGKDLRCLPLLIDDRPAPTITELRARARRAKAQHKVGLVVIDYLQYIRAPGVRGREQEVAEISRQLKAMAKELDLPVFSLAQLNRGAEHRDSAKPKLADLRDSGQIEQDADAVWFIYREEYYKKDTERQGIADIIIAKNRNGATGTVEMQWNGPTTTFRNLQAW